MVSAKVFTAKRRGYAVKIQVNPRYLPETEGRELQQLLARTVDDFKARHSFSIRAIETHLKKPKQPPEKPEVKTIQRVVTRPWHVWTCRYPLTQRTKCPVKIQGPNIGPVQHSADQHWAKHEKGAINNGTS